MFVLKIFSQATIYYCAMLAVITLSILTTTSVFISLIVPILMLFTGSLFFIALAFAIFVFVATTIFIVDFVSSQIKNLLAMN